MRTLVQKVTVFLALGALLTVGWSQSVSKVPSPQKPLEINFQSPEGMAPQDWTLIPRNPVAFTPFEMLDPNTGKPISADTIIEVNGVKMRAGDYYRQLNEMERWLNERGYSLRKDSHFPHFSPTLEAEIAESEAYAQWLAENAPLDGNIYGEDTSDFAPSACFNYSNGWNSQWFGNSLFGLQVGASVNASACLGNDLSLNAAGTARLKGRLASYETTLAEAAGNASYTADSSQARYAYNFQFSVLGRSIWAPSDSGNAPNIFQGYSNRWNYRGAQVNWSSPQIPLFGVSIFGIWIGASGQVGIMGALDLDASVNINLFAQQVSVNPYGSLSGWAAAWIGANVWIAQVEAGVRGNLTFLSGGVTGAANGTLGYDGRLYYQVNAVLNANNLNALSGNLQGYVRGCIWFFGWRCAEASAELFRWNGWNYNGTLVSWQSPRWYF